MKYQIQLTCLRTCYNSIVATAHYVKNKCLRQQHNNSKEFQLPHSTCVINNPVTELVTTFPCWFSNFWMGVHWGFTTSLSLFRRFSCIFTFRFWIWVIKEWKLDLWFHLKWWLPWFNSTKCWFETCESFVSYLKGSFT